MVLSSYEKVKAFILNKLIEVEGTLKPGKIISEINNTKILMESVSIDYLKMIFSTESIEVLKENDWGMMQRELETIFDVEMEQGVLIQGDEQRKRDTKWWTDREKLRGDNYYWNRYKKYIEKSLPFEVVKTIDVDTDGIMNNLEDPGIEEFNRYGMVVGHVQSGKTGNYAGLICKAADAGYKFIVVIAGGINNLRNQTQDRLNKSFVGSDMGKAVGVGKFPNVKRSYLPISLTTSTKDFNKRDANKNSQGLNFDNINSPIILVIKKHGSTLSNVIDWLEAQYKKQKISNHSMLLIDDESDYASINTKDEEDPAVINKKIRKLLSIFKKSAYVAYTATPYANIFIDHKVENANVFIDKKNEKENIGKDLFPRDFIYALGTPSNYFGARKIFLDTNFKHIVTIKEPENIKLKHKKEHDVTYLPDTLEEAIRCFIINIGIRRLKNQKGKHNSMLIHASRFTMVHQKIALCVEEYISILRKDIVSYGLLNNPENQSNNIKKIKETFEDRYGDVEYRWGEIIKSISNVIESLIIREVHQKKSVELEYSDECATNVIVIGGTSLSRGYTLEGLSISYFMRRTIYYDTLMQMARWFGYREGYEDLCKIYMTKDMRDNFKRIIEATEDLFEDFRIMENEKKTPEDFGLAIQQHPDSGLQVTARNKQKNIKEIYYEMNLAGSLKETSWITKDELDNKKNVELIRSVISNLENIHKKDTSFEKSYLWKAVNKEIVKEFINSFILYNSDVDVSDFFGIRSKMPIKFIKKYIDDIDIEWDIALYSGQGKNIDITEDIIVAKEKRKLDEREKCFEVRNRQVSSGNAESISLSDEECEGINRSKRKEVRKRLIRPLLMLHILETEQNPEIAAFGISFPGSITSSGRTVVLKINTVYIENLLKEEEYDD